jgi:hypothetical protein
MKDWLLSFVAAATVVGLIVWCTSIVVPFLRVLYVG